MAMAVTTGVLNSVRMANLRVRIKTLDEPGCCEVYRLGRNALGLASSKPLEFETKGLGWSYGDKPTFVLTRRTLRKTRSTVEF
jgi:hypothetical protein